MVRTRTLKHKLGMCFGTFASLHEGHLHYLESSSKLCEKLIVVVARIENLKIFKPGRIFSPAEERARVIRKKFPEFKVILGSTGNIYQVLKEHNPDLICLGYDQKGNIEKIKTQLPNCTVTRIDAYFPDKYKSSIISLK